MCVTCGLCSNPDCKDYTFFGGGDPCPECTSSPHQMSRRTAITQGPKVAQSSGGKCLEVLVIGMGYAFLVAALVRDNWPL